MSQVLLPAGLALLMAVVGMRMTFAGLADVFRRPRGLATGLFVQMALLPAMAFVVAKALGLSPAMATGLMVIAAAPGGITSNYVAMAANADLALSTAMTLVTTLAAGASIPLVLALGGVLPTGEGAAFAGLARMGVAMFAVAAVPLTLGILVRRFFPGAVARREALLSRLSALVFAAIVLATFWENRHAMAENALSIGPAAALLNILAIAAAFAFGTLAGLPRAGRFAIAIETGLQNVAMAMFVATALIGRSELTAPALVYAVLMNLSALALIALGRRHVTAAPVPA